MTSRSRPSSTVSAACGPRSGPIALMRSASIRMSPTNGVLPWISSMAMMLALRMRVDMRSASWGSALRAGHQGGGLAAFHPFLEDGIGLGRHELAGWGRARVDRMGDVVGKAVDRQDVGRIGQ